MITKVTTNICGTLIPDGKAQTSARPVCFAKPVGQPGVIEGRETEHQARGW